MKIKFLALFFILTISVSVFSLNKRVLFVTGDWPPYSGSELDNLGIFTDIAFTAFRKMNIPAKVEFYPWTRCEHMIQKGEAFATYPYNRTKNRLEKYNFSVPVTDGKYVFFFSNQRYKFQVPKELTTSELKNYHVGALKGYFYIEIFQNNNFNFTFEKSEIQCFKLLQNGRIDFFPMDLNVGLYLINKHFPNEKGTFSYAYWNGFPPKPYYYLISKKYPNSNILLKKFNDTLTQMKSDGTIQAIESRHR